MKRGRRQDEEDEEDASLEGGGAYGKLLESLGVSQEALSSSSSSGEEEGDEDEVVNDHGEHDDHYGEEGDEDDEEDGSDDDGEHSYDAGAIADPHEGEFYEQGEKLRDADPYVRLYCTEWTEQDVEKWRATEPHYVTVAKLDVPVVAELVVSSDFPLKPASNKGQTRRLVRDGFIKEKLAARWTRDMTPLQLSVFPALTHYCDLTLPVLLGTDERAQMRDLVAFHAMNHVLKAREREWENSALLRNKQLGEAQDQGFTPVRAVFVLPMRCDAYDLVRRMIALSPFGEGAVENRRKFELEMAADEVPSNKGKPLDYKERFNGNSDDSFRFGIRFTRSTMRLFSGFYHSDIIVCSPLGLRTIIGDDNDLGRDFDFLSSVEIVVFDSCEMLQMQNWEHVELMMRCMNRVPSKIGETDFARLQSHFVNEWAPWLRQTVLLSQVHTPELNALMRRFAVNPRKGHMIVQHSGVLQNAGSLNQLFQKVPFSSVAAAADERFDYFTKTLLPGLLQAQRFGTLVFIPNYFDYLRVRQHLKSLNVDFCHICEYTKKSDVARDRTDFAKRNARIMLYTERVHFYHRIKIRGTENVVFYALPNFAHFYTEVMGFISPEQRSSASVVALYSPVDRLALERIVGTQRCDIILQSAKNTHMFST